MRLDLRFARPLDREQRIAFLLAIAALGKSRSATFARGHHAAVVMGEAMGVVRVREALAAVGLEAVEISSSLPDEEGARVDVCEQDEVSGRERVRPIGR